MNQQNILSDNISDLTALLKKQYIPIAIKTRAIRI